MGSVAGAGEGCKGKCGAEYRGAGTSRGVWGLGELVWGKKGKLGLSWGVRGAGGGAVGASTGGGGPFLWGKPLTRGCGGGDSGWGIGAGSSGGCGPCDSPGEEEGPYNKISLLSKVSCKPLKCSNAGVQFRMIALTQQPENCPDNLMSLELQ